MQRFTFCLWAQLDTIKFKGKEEENKVEEMEEENKVEEVEEDKEKEEDNGVAAGCRAFCLWLQLDTIKFKAPAANSPDVQKVDNGFW